MSKAKQSGVFIRNNPAAPQLCPELAKEIGLNESILLLQLEYWLTRQGELRDDGYVWVRKPIHEIRETFGFWSVGTVNAIIEALCRKGYVVAAGLDGSPGRSGRWLRLNTESLATLKSIRVFSDSEKPFFRNTPDLVQDLKNRPNISFKDKDIYTAVAENQLSPTGYKQPKRTKVLLPDDFIVTDGMRNWAHGLGLSDDEIDNATERHARHVKKTEKHLHADKWSLDWEEWVLNDVKFRNNGNGHKQGETDRSYHSYLVAPEKPVGYFDEMYKDFKTE
jgi:hypothetical protein